MTPVRVANNATFIVDVKLIRSTKSSLIVAIVAGECQIEFILDFYILDIPATVCTQKKLLSCAFISSF